MPDKQLNIFLLMGQSNMAGRGDMDGADRLEHPRVLMFRDAQWTRAREPLHDDKASAGIGLGMSFAVSVAEGNPDSHVGLVPCAVGGTPLSRWQKGGDLYRRALALAQEVEKGGKIQGILWHQGETDAIEEEDARTYFDRFTAMINDLRDDLGAESVPLVIGELGRFLETSEAIIHHEVVNEALRSAAQALPLCALANSEGLKDRGDRLHFSSPSLREFGRRYALEYENIMRRHGLRLLPLRAP